VTRISVPALRHRKADRVQDYLQAGPYFDRLDYVSPFDGQKHLVPAHPTDRVNHAQAAEARTGDDGKHDVSARELPMAIISIESAGHDFRREGFDLRALVRAP